MARNEPSPFQMLADEVRAQRNENNINHSATRADMKVLADKMEKAVDSAMAHAELAHKRLDARENRERGLLLGVGLGSGTFGAFLAKILPGLIGP